MKTAARKSFDEIGETHVLKNVTVQTKILEGRPADEIIRETEEEKADIIVMAIHDWTGRRRFMFGSVA